MANLLDYTGLITSEHQDKPDFVATVTVSAQPLVDLQNVMGSIPLAYDIDTAVGAQLDVLGIWIGRSRYIGTPITGVYFEWDGDATVGWQGGVWQGPFDPSSGVVSLPDENYRLLLKTKIVANRWDGSIPQAYAIWESIFPDSAIAIQDNQDMTMVIILVGQPLDAVSKALLLGGYIPLKPEGVRIDHFDILPAAGLMFAWDIDTVSQTSAWSDGYSFDSTYPIQSVYFGGWDQAQWPLEVQPT